MNDVCCGLQYLHNRNPPIIHQDLTPKSILLCSHFRAKIAGLGADKIMHTTDTSTPTQVYGLPSDIFSFGRVALYICIHQWPELASLIKFDSNTGERIKLQQHRRYVDKMTGVYADLKPLLISCLDGNPKNRPPVAQALLEIKHIKHAYNEKLYHTLTSDNQLTTQLQSQKNQSTHLQQHEHDQQHNQEQQELQKVS